MNSSSQSSGFRGLPERPQSVRVFRHRFQADPHIVAGEIDMLPAEWRQMGQQIIRDKIRQLLVLGATSMVGRADGWHSAVGGWLRNILERRPVRLVTVALANKMARIAWAKLAKVPGNRLRLAGRPGEGVMTRKEVYRPKGGVTVAAQAAA